MSFFGSSRKGIPACSSSKNVAQRVISVDTLLMAEAVRSRTLSSLSCSSSSLICPERVSMACWSCSLSLAVGSDSKVRLILPNTWARREVTSRID